MLSQSSPAMMPNIQGMLVMRGDLAKVIGIEQVFCVLCGSGIVVWLA
jgi:hypothetical protein